MPRRRFTAPLWFAALTAVAAFGAPATADDDEPIVIEVRPAAPAIATAPRVPSHWVTPGPPQSWHGEPIDLSLENADLREVLRSFAKLSGMSLVLDPDVRGQVTVELEDVPWDQALFVILKTHGLAAEIDGNVWTATPLPERAKP